jgi:hypothetical protein
MLGSNIFFFKLVLPAAFLHGMANFRGMKPLFKSYSLAPWIEMQLQTWTTADDEPPIKVFERGFDVCVCVRVNVDSE